MSPMIRIFEIDDLQQLRKYLSTLPDIENNRDGCLPSSSNVPDTKMLQSGTVPQGYREHGSNQFCKIGADKERNRHLRVNPR